MTAKKVEAEKVEEEITKSAPKAVAHVKVEVATRSRKKWHVTIAGHGEVQPDIKAAVANLEASGQVIDYARISNEQGTEVIDVLASRA
jgi:translation initiation factor 1 (eIF-1/SUI1)